MNKKIITILLQIIVFGFCIGMVIWGFWGRRKLMNNHSVTIAHIDDCTTGGRGNAGTLSIDFTISVNGKKYKSSSGYLTSELSVSNCNNYFVGKSFPAVYDSTSPSNSTIMIFPRYFTQYGYEFPDSLKWVLKYKK